MRAAALTNATPDARSLQNRTGSDGTPPDDGFDTALADVAQTGSDARAVAGASWTASAQASPDLVAATPGQAVAALLAKVAAQAKTGGGADAGDTTTATGPVKASDDTVTDPLAAMSALLPGLVTTAKAAPSVSIGDKAATKDSANASTDPGPAVAGANPLATMAALLPGLVAAPAATAAAAAASKDAQPASDPAKISLALDAMSSAKGPRSQDPAKSTEDASDAPDVGFTLVASSTHLAPVSSASVLGAPVGADAAEASKSDAATVSKASAASLAAPSASASAETDSHVSASVDAVATRPEPDSKLTNGTLQAIAGAVTSLAADATPAASDIDRNAAPSAAATVADPTPTSAAPARSLTLQLTPGDLGSVTVRLHMTSNGLAVDLAVDDRKTLASISHARDELASAIGDNGYRVESLTIRGADASSTSTAGSNDSARSQSEAGAGQSFSGGGSGSSGGDAPSRQRAEQSPVTSRDAGRDRDADGVFV